MRTQIAIDQDSRERSLNVDAYGRLNKRQFISKLSELESVHVLRKNVVFSLREFCRFKYKEEVFSITVDDWDYSFVIKPDEYNRHTLGELENYFSNVHAPKPKTRPAFVFAGLVLVGLALYVNIFSS